MNDVCKTAICPTGMVCSEKLQHCVCDIENDYEWQGDFELIATIFDFSRYNEDFENGEPDPVGLASQLGDDDNPVFISENANRFSTWYTETEDVNMKTEIVMDLDWQDSEYTLGTLEFFPIDNQLFGNEGYEHNYHFTTKTTWEVDYSGGEFIYLRYDDGILLYLNRWLIVNEPGLHFNGSTYLELDSVAGDAGMVPGNSYDLHIFHMERHLSESQFLIRTNLLIHPPTCPNVCDTDDQCVHGLCHPIRRTCVCQNGWAGDYCSQELCWNVDCGEYGECSPYDGLCYCDNGWAGDQCNLRTCNYHGEIDSIQDCICDNNYEGDGCDLCVSPVNANKMYLCKNNGNGKNHDYKRQEYNTDDVETLLNNSNYIVPGTDGINCGCGKDNKNWDPCAVTRYYEPVHDWCDNIYNTNTHGSKNARHIQARDTLTGSFSDKEAVSDKLFLLRRQKVIIDEVVNTSSQLLVPQLMFMAILAMLMV